MRRGAPLAGGVTVALLLGAALLAAGAGAHVAPPPPLEEQTDVEEIPERDAELYRSYIRTIEPRVRGLRARILGGQERLEVTWTGRVPLVIEGAQGEPMLRVSARGVEVNERSPSAILSADRYGRVTLPEGVDPDAPPRWRLIDTPGPISWYEHRAQWMEAERPEVVGDGARGTNIFHWEVPARLGDRRVRILGNLDWRPDPRAIREERSEASHPLLTAAILLAAMGLGAGVGVLVRRRIAPAPGG